MFRISVHERSRGGEEAVKWPRPSPLKEAINSPAAYVIRYDVQDFSRCVYIFTKRGNEDR